MPPLDASSQLPPAQLDALYALALPHGVLFYARERACLALRRTTGEVVLCRLRPPRTPAYAGPERPLAHARWRLASALRLGSQAVRQLHRQSEALAPAELGAAGLVELQAGPAERRAAERSHRAAAWQVGLGVALAPLGFALEPLALAPLEQALARTGAGGPLLAALVASLAALSFVPLYVRGLRLFSPWRRLYGYHAAGHEVRAAFRAGRPLKLSALRGAHGREACGLGALVVAALLATLASHCALTLAGGGESWQAVGLRALLVLPALWLGLALPLPPGPDAPAARGGAALPGVLPTAWLPAHEPPSDAMREVALCALLGLLEGAADAEAVQRSGWGLETAAWLPN